jgi:hypothetical protein
VARKFRGCSVVPGYLSPFRSQNASAILHYDVHRKSLIKMTALFNFVRRGDHSHPFQMTTGVLVLFVPQRFLPILMDASTLLERSQTASEA